MRRLAIYLLGACMIASPVSPESINSDKPEYKSRQELGIPTEGKPVGVGALDLDGKLCEKRSYDTNGNGKADIHQFYMPDLPGSRNPWMIFYDRKEDGEWDDNELYFSPKMDEKWVAVDPPKKKARNPYPEDDMFFTGPEAIQAMKLLSI